MRVNYKNERGYKYLVEIPDEFQDEPELGIIIGPPDLESLGLPENYEVKLNNQLFDRQLFNWSDVRRRPDDIRAALKATLRVDEQAIIRLYKEERSNGNTV